jgi:signal transduction histidine kinase
MVARCGPAGGPADGHAVALRPLAAATSWDRSAVLAATGDGMLLVAVDGCVAYANARLARLLGLDDEALDGTAAVVLARHLRGCGPEPAEAFDRVLLGPELVDELPPVRARVQRPQARTLQLSAAPVRGPSGALLGRLVVVRDVTGDDERERATEALVGTVSHELRTPLTSIRGFVDLLRAGRAGPITEKQREFLAIVAQDAAYLTRLVDDLLEVERASRAPLESVAVELTPLLAEVLAGEASVAEAKGLQLSFEAPGLPLVALGDPARIRQVAANLLSNSVKYTQAGRVVLRASTAGPGRVALEVEDSGIGLPPADRDRLFQRFFRADHPVVRAAPGTGLGLTIVRTLVERMDGRVELGDAPGGGTRARVELPTPPRRGAGP